MIEVNHLTKRYGSILAVNDISFKVEEGQVLGFLGPNGAGKTTTMNMLTGYLSASSGDAYINGYNVLTHPKQVKSNIGYLPEQPPLYPDMTVREYLDFMFDLKRCRMNRREHIADICKTVRIENVYTRMIKNLSKGYKQRVGLAQALIGNPPVLILDEPTVGLDPNQIVEIRELIKRLGVNHTVILSSHILHEVEASCDRVVIIHKGVIAADGTPSQLAGKFSVDHRLMVRVAGPETEVLKLIERINGVRRVVCAGAKEPGVFEYAVEPKEEADIRRDLFSRLSDHHWPILGLRSMEMSLEEIFISLTAKESPNLGSKKTKSKKGGNRT